MDFLIFCAIRAFYSTIGLIDFVTVMNWSKKSFNKTMLTIFGFMWMLISIFSSDEGFGKIIFILGFFLMILNALYGTIIFFKHLHENKKISKESAV